MSNISQIKKLCFSDNEIEIARDTSDTSGIMQDFVQTVEGIVSKYAKITRGYKHSVNKIDNALHWFVDDEIFCVIKTDCKVYYSLSYPNARFSMYKERKEVFRDLITALIESAEKYGILSIQVCGCVSLKDSREFLGSCGFEEIAKVKKIPFPTTDRFLDKNRIRVIQREMHYNAPTSWLLECCG